MIDYSPRERPAHKIPCGHAVHRPNDMDPKNLFMKAERMGAAYIHYYLIQISLVGSIDLALIYIDPEENLIDLGYNPTFDLICTKACKKPKVGHIFKSENGTFLKVIEDPKSQKMHAFIDISSGEIKRRQERKINVIYDTWEIINII
jgi:hypothetical protein